jgi:signal transduction histidine kinase
VFVSIRSRLLLSHIAVALIAAVAASVYLFVSFMRLQGDYSEHALLSSAYALADAVETDFGTPHGRVLVEHAMRELAQEEKAQFAVMDMGGTVVSSTASAIHSGSRLPLMEGVRNGKPHVYRPEADSPDQERIIVDVPLERDDAVIGVVRAWILEKDYQSSLSPIKRVTGFALAGVIALSVGLSLLLAYALISPIKRMRRLSRRIAQGDFRIRMDKLSGDELGELATDLNTMAARLQDLENSRRDFFGNVSHELRSPVSNIRITSEVLQRRAERLGDDSAKLFQTVITETERLETMINELIELAAIKSGALVLNKEAFNLEALTDELMLGISPRAQQKQQTVEVLVDPDMIIVADRDRIARAISNLLDNAVKFTPVAGRITLSARRESGHVVIEISDTGEGIAPEDLPKVFERFYRADKARRRDGGSGIGLAIAKNVVEAHGGTIDVESKEGQGSTFRISLGR